MAVTWVAVSQSAVKPLPWWPLWIFACLGIIGIVGFLLAIYRPHTLPGHKKHLEEQEGHREAEVALAARKAHAEGMAGLTAPTHQDNMSRKLTDAMNRLSSALERQEERQEDSNSSSAGTT